jgi:hypothetical protein
MKEKAKDKQRGQVITLHLLTWLADRRHRYRATMHRVTGCRIRRAARYLPGTPGRNHRATAAALWCRATLPPRCRAVVVSIHSTRERPSRSLADDRRSSFRQRRMEGGLVTPAAHQVTGRAGVDPDRWSSCPGLTLGGGSSRSGRRDPHRNKNRLFISLAMSAGEAS